MSPPGGKLQSIYSDFPAVAYGARSAWLPDGSVASNKNDSRSTPNAVSAIWVLGPGVGLQLHIADAFDLPVS